MSAKDMKKPTAYEVTLQRDVQQVVRVETPSRQEAIDEVAPRPRKSKNRRGRS